MILKTEIFRKCLRFRCARLKNVLILIQKFTEHLTHDCQGTPNNVYTSSTAKINRFMNFMKLQLPYFSGDYFYFSCMQYFFFIFGSQWFFDKYLGLCVRERPAQFGLCL